MTRKECDSVDFGADELSVDYEKQYAGLDEQCTPKAVAGCPPDGFSAEGQLWGNPLYDWDYHKKTEYAWWIERLSFCFELYDVVHIDNETLVGWWQEVDDEGRKKVRDYLCDYYTPADKINIPLIGAIMRSNAKICIVPIQDYLGLDNKSRMNTPSSVDCNWRWRVDGKELNETLAKEIKEITVRYGCSN